MITLIVSRSILVDTGENVTLLNLAIITSVDLPSFQKKSQIEKFC